jgi:hypothetical protein
MLDEATVGEFRRRLNTQLDEQRERLLRLDDSTLAALLEHIRGLYPDPHFDAAGLLCNLIFIPVPSLGGVTPAEALTRDDGLGRVKQLLGQQAAGVSP